MSRGEIFYRQVGNPITELVVMRRDKSAQLAVKGMEYGKSGVASVAVTREVWGIYTISQEEGISPFLRTQFCPIYRGRLHRHSCPRLCFLLKLTCNLDRNPH